MKMIGILLIGCLVMILIVGSGCCEKESDDTQDITTEEKSKIDDSKIERKVIDRTYTTDTFDNGDGTFTQTNYMGAVNIWWWDEFIPVEEYLNPVVDGDSLVFNDPNGNKIIGFEMNYEKEDALSLASPKIEVNSFRGGYYFETDADTEVKSMEFELSSDYVDEFELIDGMVYVNDIFTDFGMAKREQNITTKLIETITYDGEEEIKTYKLNFSIEEGKTGSLKMIDPNVGLTSPTTTSTAAGFGWVDPTNAYASDNSDASQASGTGGDAQYYGGFGFSVPSGYIINGIILSIEGAAQNDAGELIGKLTWDNKNTFTSTKTTSSYSTGVDQTKELGGSSDTWGRTWSGSEFDDSVFHIYVENDNDRILTDHIQVDIYYTVPSYSLNLTYPTTTVPKSVSANDTLTLFWNITSGGTIVPSGVTPFNISIGDSEAYLHNHTSIGDVFKYRGEASSSGTDSNNPETFTFWALPDTDYSALITPGSDTDGCYSSTFLSKGVTSFQFKIEDDAGGNEAVSPVFLTAIPQGYNTINSTSYIECGSCGAGSSCSPTFTTAFPDTNYAIFCNTADDTDSPNCISYNTGSEKTTTGFQMNIYADDNTAESVSAIDWCAISYGMWNISRESGDDIMVQVGKDTITTWGSISTQTINLYGDMPSDAYVVQTTHEDNDATDPAVCKAQTFNTDRFAVDCEDDAGGDGGAGEFVYWMAISLDGDANLTKTEIVDDFGLADDGHNHTANVTAPSSCSGSSDLFVDVLYGGNHVNSTESGAITCGAGDSCDCPGDSSAHEFDLSDYCIVETCTAGDVTFTDTGNITCTGVWNIDSLGDVGEGSIFWVNSGCDLDVG